MPACTNNEFPLVLAASFLKKEMFSAFKDECDWHARGAMTNLEGGGGGGRGGGGGSVQSVEIKPSK